MARPRALCCRGGDYKVALRGLVPVVSLRQVEDGVAVVRWRNVLHASGLSGVVQSASFGSLSTLVHACSFWATTCVWMIGGCCRGFDFVAFAMRIYLNWLGLSRGDKL